ncbi:MAG: hypothetical protein VX619_04625 [bacterium]|nr:hypothetical protein [bacterium]
MSNNQLIVIGCGVLGKLIFYQWDGNFTGIVKSHDSVEALSLEGIIASTIMPSNLDTQSVVFATNGSPNQFEAIESFVDLNPNFTGKAILISSTSYYQGTQGPVDEESQGGNTSRSKACQEVENIFKSSFSRGWVLRCGGLFKEGRGPFAYLAKTKQIPAIPTGQQLALFSYRDLQRLVIFLLHKETQTTSTLLCTVAKCPTRFEYYKAAFEKLNLPFQLSKDPLSGPVYNSKKLFQIFEPIDSDWTTALI